MFGSCNIPPGPDQPYQSATKFLVGAERRNQERGATACHQDNIPEGKALGDGRRPAVGLPEGRPRVLLYDIKRYEITPFTFTPRMALPYSSTC